MVVEFQTVLGINLTVKRMVSHQLLIDGQDIHIVSIDHIKALLSKNTL
jgi:hypothetical protein